LRYLTVNEHQSLEFAETQIPQILEDECLVRVKTAGINRADLLQKAGMYPPPKGESEILGIEAAGEIDKLGDKVSGWQVNQAVYCLVPGGGYAEYVKVKAKHLMPLNKNFTFEQGAGIAETYLTAYQSLFLIADLQPNQRVLIHAGASGVGCAAIQLAKAKGCFVVTTIGSEEKAKACINLGADVAINYRNDDFESWAKQEKQQFDVILDVVAGGYVGKNINVAALDAKIVTLAMLGGRFAENVDIAKMLGKRITLQASTLRNRRDEYKANLVEQFQCDFGKLIEKGELVPVVDSVYSWREANAAHDKMAQNANIGKLVLVID